MNSLKVRINAAGTMANEFRIGKYGPTILHGEEEPSDSTGNSGDLYIMLGATPSLFQKRGNTWVLTADPTFGFVRQAVTTETATILPKTTYVGVNISGLLPTGDGAPPGVEDSPSITPVVYLPQGTPGKQLIIKDEGGNAADYPITVSAVGGATIDGQTSWVLDIQYGSLHLIYGETQWHIVSGIASSPYNMMRV